MSLRSARRSARAHTAPVRPRGVADAHRPAPATPSCARRLRRITWLTLADTRARGRPAVGSAPSCSGSARPAGLRQQRRAGLATPASAPRRRRGRGEHRVGLRARGVNRQRLAVCGSAARGSQAVPRGGRTEHVAVTRCQTQLVGHVDDLAVDHMHVALRTPRALRVVRTITMVAPSQCSSSSSSIRWRHLAVEVACGLVGEQQTRAAGHARAIATRCWPPDSSAGLLAGARRPTRSARASRDPRARAPSCRGRGGGTSTLSDTFQVGIRLKA